MVLSVILTLILSTIAALKHRCKYWDILHPIFANRTSSRPAFTADNLDDNDVVGDLLGQVENDDDNHDHDNEDYNHDHAQDSDHDQGDNRDHDPDQDDNRDHDHDYNYDHDNHDDNSRALIPERLKGKKPMKLGNRIQKNSKPSLAEAFLAGNIAKDERKKESLAFAKRKWEGMMEEKKKKLELEEENRKREHEVMIKKLEVEEMRIKNEKILAKTSLMKMLSDLGMSKEDVLNQVKDL